jgi:hypothetical protein
MNYKQDILGVIYNLEDKENDYKNKDITQTCPLCT